MYLVLFFITLFGSLTAQLVQLPTVLSQKEIEALPKSTSLTWDKKYGAFHFETKDNEVVFQIFFPGELPLHLSDSEQNLFKKTDDGYFFSFHYPSGTINGTACNHSKWAHSLTLAEPRAFSNAQPFRLPSLGRLVRLLKNKKVIFYTGAGISKAAGIPTMCELDNLLGFDKEQNFAVWAQNTIHNPRALSQHINAFHRACFSSKPTRAHQALSELANLKKIKIFTENLDHLHQKTGFDVVSVTSELKGLEALKNVDLIVCLGLSRDNKGFLAKFKEYNPNGRIIAVDLKQPNYLGNEDVWLEADLQEMMPDLLYALKKVEKN
ncbi:MAG TPA: Sir2 family NAD-dependent protein deacetylase [Rhabdochlamydiaceae bacterium]|nr:Sir2 family NAD-dependent protein deacetylase [Rhabdochlamydiaceae bacterium]